MQSDHNWQKVSIFFPNLHPQKKFEDLQKNSKICTEIQRFAQKFDRLHKNSTVCGALFFCNSFSRIVTHFLDPYFLRNFGKSMRSQGGSNNHLGRRHCTYSPEISCKYSPEISCKYIPEISCKYIPEISSKYIPEISCKYIPEISCKYIPAKFSTIFPVNSPTICTRYYLKNFPTICTRYYL